MSQTRTRQLLLSSKLFTSMQLLVPTRHGMCTSLDCWPFDLMSLDHVIAWRLIFSTWEFQFLILSLFVSPVESRLLASLTQWAFWACLLDCCRNRRRSCFKIRQRMGHPGLQVVAQLAQSRARFLAPRLSSFLGRNFSLLTYSASFSLQELPSPNLAHRLVVAESKVVRANQEPAIRKRY